jgi:hypothetical protein
VSTDKDLSISNTKNITKLSEDMEWIRAVLWNRIQNRSRIRLELEPACIPDHDFGSTTLVIALGEQHGTVLYSINTGILISCIGGSPEERTAGRQDELVSLHRVSITYLK